VPTVLRLTSKLQGSPNLALCPLCLGIKDEIKCLLEIGSPITAITKQGVERIHASDDWFKSDVEKSFCFGCKRLCIEAADKSQLLASLPDFILTQ
jgi:hypothetical protein